MPYTRWEGKTCEYRCSRMATPAQQLMPLAQGKFTTTVSVVDRTQSDVGEGLVGSTACADREIEDVGSVVVYAAVAGGAGSDPALNFAARCLGAVDACAVAHLVGALRTCRRQRIGPASG